MANQQPHDIRKQECSVATGPAPIVSATGACAGINGKLIGVETLAEEGSLLTNGNCNQANNAPGVPQDLIVTASGRVSF